MFISVLLGLGLLSQPHGLQVAQNNIADGNFVCLAAYSFSGDWEGGCGGSPVLQDGLTFKTSIWQNGCDDVFTIDNELLAVGGSRQEITSVPEWNVDKKPYWLIVQKQLSWVNPDSKKTLELKVNSEDFSTGISNMMSTLYSLNEDTLTVTFLYPGSEPYSCELKRKDMPILSGNIIPPKK